MSAPIAEIPPPAPPQPAKKAPLSLSVMVAVGLILGVFSLIFYTPTLSEIGISADLERVIVFAVMTIFSFVPLVLLWRGWSWARWLMMTIIVLSYLTLLFEMTTPPTAVERVLFWIHMFYDVGLLIFLWTPAMRRHFNRNN